MIVKDELIGWLFVIANEMRCRAPRRLLGASSMARWDNIYVQRAHIESCVTICYHDPSPGLTPMFARFPSRGHQVFEDLAEPSGSDCLGFSPMRLEGSNPANLAVSLSSSFWIIVMVDDGWAWSQMMLDFIRDLVRWWSSGVELFCRHASAIHVFKSFVQGGPPTMYKLVYK